MQSELFAAGYRPVQEHLDFRYLFAKIKEGAMHNGAYAKAERGHGLPFQLY